MGGPQRRSCRARPQVDFLQNHQKKKIRLCRFVIGSRESIFPTFHDFGVRFRPMHGSRTRQIFHLWDRQMRIELKRNYAGRLLLEPILSPSPLALRGRERADMERIFLPKRISARSRSQNPAANPGGSYDYQLR